jgi:hypothetical protein
MPKPVTELRSRYLGTRGVGERYAGASPKAVREWVKQGVLPAPDLRIHGHQYWLEESLDAHDRKRTIEAADRRPVGQFGTRRTKRSASPHLSLTA